MPADKKMRNKFFILLHCMLAMMVFPASAQRRDGYYRFENKAGIINEITIRGDSIWVLQQQTGLQTGKALQFELSVGTWRPLNKGRYAAFLTVMACDTCAGYFTLDSIARNNPKFDEWITGPPDTTIYKGDTIISQPSLILPKDAVNASRYRELIVTFTRKGRLRLNGHFYQRYKSAGWQPRRVH